MASNYTFRNISGRILFHREEYLLNTLSGQLVTTFTLFDVCMVLIISSFVAWTKDWKINYERQPVFLPKRPPNGFRLYAVLLETGHSPAGGTTSSIFIRICGKYTKSPGFTLVCTNGQRLTANKRLFDSQNKDLFIISLPHYLGGIEAFEVATDRKGDSPPWFLKSIRVMCLDNKKCWKSNVGAWLRGDLKPYHIKARIIGALSTREYLTKVFLQNHNWTFTWFRSLGSQFTCLQRCSIHWTSLGISLGVSHYLLYDVGIVNNVTSGIIDTPSYTSNEMAQAAVIGAGVGVIVGSVLRFLTRLLSEGSNCGKTSKFERVDDKDDFSHLMGNDRLDYAQGAVVQIPISPFDECLGHLNLNKDQIRAVKHIAECDISSCSLKNRLEFPNCAPTHDCCYARSPDEQTYSEDSDNPGNIKAVKVATEKLAPIRFQSDSESTGVSMDSEKMVQQIMPHNRMMASKRGYKDSIASEMNVIWENERELPKSAAVGNALNKFKSLKPSARSKRSKKYQIPTVSARTQSSDESDVNFDRYMGGKDKNQAVQKDDLSILSQLSRSTKNDEKEFDSLSETETDQEMATKSARTNSEINLTRRPDLMYETAPKWNDSLRVWIQAAKGGKDHHKALNRRYDCTALDQCCLRTDEGISLELMIKKYKEEEGEAPDGRVRLGSGIIATTLALVGAVAATTAVGLTLYQRLYMPNADTLIYLYAVLIVLVLHPLVFSTADAMLCALLATWARRRRIMNQKRENARKIERAEELEVDGMSNPSSLKS